MSQASLNLASVNARQRHCHQCGCLAPFDEPANALEKMELFRLNQSGTPIKFMARCREMTGCDLASAKAVHQHQTHERGVCHWCRSPIAAIEYMDCQHCGAFNIWWGDMA